MFGLDQGKLEKMKITAYMAESQSNDLSNLSTNPDDQYVALVNPEKYQIRHEIKRDERQAPGTSGTDPRFVGNAPFAFQFEFLFDATGVIPKPPEGLLDSIPILGAVADALSGGDDAYDVMAEIQRFNHVVLDYAGEEHAPRRVYINWGTLGVSCKLNTLTYDFKLFKPDGTPLRAVANAAFVESIPDEERENRDKPASPDLTHQRVVKEGDTLPLLAREIYGDASLYLEVARVNGLVHFRNLPVGTVITFPPIDKSKI
ncbi:MAG: hypothetical protein KDC66_13905 [Phaeodactylibacter sp.]|nr:hypothetical protein [Phaeodactylibacter sp.]MCB9274941.1 LysM peptidoglycan-binding domain-containing protein [Lewinellaceae bacterium]